jgi:hypothetical protein
MNSPRSPLVSVDSRSTQTTSSTKKLQIDTTQGQKLETCYKLSKSMTIDPVENLLIELEESINQNEPTQALLANISTENQQNKIVEFAGFFLVQSATSQKHVRYAMEISSRDLDIKVRCVQRYSTFYSFRKRLLKILKRCKISTRYSVVDESKGFCCEECLAVRKKIKAIKFPKRKLFTRVHHVEERSVLLEAFLDSCLQKIVHWKGCERGRRFAAALIGHFIGMNLLLHLMRPSEMKLDTEISDETEPEVEASQEKEGTSSDAECFFAFPQQKPINNNQVEADKGSNEDN